MAQLISDKKDIDFLLHEILEASLLAEHEEFKEFNKKTMDLILKEARNLALKEIAPSIKNAMKKHVYLKKVKFLFPKK